MKSPLRWVAALAIAWTLLIFGVMAARISFPLELEWMEGGSLHQAQRLLAGEPVYAAPSVEFVPFLYTPLYPALIAAFGKLFGLSYALARTLSWGFAVATVAALWVGVRRELELDEALENEARRWQPWLAVGLFCAGYVFTFRWLDLARADACFLAFASWGLVLLRGATRDSRVSMRGVAAAGVCLGLAFWAKQTAALFIVAAGVWTLFCGWRAALVLVATVGVVDGIGVLIGQALTDGWLWTYIYELHQSHAFNRVRFTRKTWGMFLHAAPFVALALGTWAWRGRKAWRAPSPRAEGLRFWSLATAAALLASALGYSTQWAEPNAFLPGVAMGALLVAVALPSKGRARPWGLGFVGGQLIFSLLLEPMYQPIQDRGWRALGEAYRWQDPGRSLPSAAQREGAAALRAELEAGTQSGRRLLAPQREWWTFLGGAPSEMRGHVGSMGLNDVAKADRQRLRAQLREQLEAGAWDEIWIEGSLAPWSWLRPTLMRTFRVRERREGLQRVRPMVGYMSVAGMVTEYRGPQLWLERIEAPAPVPAGGAVLTEFEQRNHAVAGPDSPICVREGAAFGARPVRSIHRQLPAVGPVSGAQFASSAAGNKAERDQGRLRCAELQIPAGATRLRWWSGRSADGEGLHARLVRDDDAHLELPLGGVGWRLEPGELALPPGWAGRRVSLELVDESREAALFFDALVALP